MELHRNLNVEDTDDCIEWPGAYHANGYGVVSLNRQLAKDLGLGRVQFAHRASYIQANGLILKGLVVRHKCNNQRCFNPKHLVTGSQRENIQDAIEAGSIIPKVTEEDVKEIRNSKESQRKLAVRYGTSPTTICKIRKGDKWRHV